MNSAGSNQTPLLSKDDGEAPHGSATALTLKQKGLLMEAIGSAGLQDLKFLEEAIAARKDELGLVTRDIPNVWSLGSGPTKPNQEQLGGLLKPKGPKGQGSKNRESKSPPSTDDEAKPRRGERGSGYTKIPGGRLVRNKRPSKDRVLQDTQSRNWIDKTQQALKSYVGGTYKKSAKVVKTKPPSGDARYDNLVADLEWAKAYRRLVRQALKAAENRDQVLKDLPRVDAFRAICKSPVILNGKITARAVERDVGKSQGFIKTFFESLASDPALSSESEH